MTALRLSRLAGGVAVVTVLVVTGLVTWSMLWPADPDASLQLDNGRMLGDLSGYIGRIDRDARTMDVSTSRLGLRPVVLMLTNDTAIMVQDKHGGLGDLGIDMPVRVFYEVRDNVRYATAIQVVATDAQASRPGASETVAAPPTKSPTAAEPAAPAPDAPALVAPALVPPVAPKVTPPPAAPSVARPGPEPTRPPELPAPVAPASPKSTPLPAPSVARSGPEPTRPPELPAPAAPASPKSPPRPAPSVAQPAPERAPARTPAASAQSGPAVEAASITTRPAARADARDTDVGDGSAAIDWLFKEAGRR